MLSAVVENPLQISSEDSYVNLASALVYTPQSGVDTFSSDESYSAIAVPVYHSEFSARHDEFISE